MIETHNENTIFLLTVRHIGPKQEEIFSTIIPKNGSEKAQKSKFIIDEFGAIPSNSKRQENTIFIRGKFTNGYFNIWIGCRGKVKYIIWKPYGTKIEGNNFKDFLKLTNAN